MLDIRKKLLNQALHKKNFSHSEMNIQHELETNERRLTDLETNDQNIKNRFELIERRLSKLEDEKEP